MNLIEMRAAQFERYLKLLDKFENDLRVDVPKKTGLITSEYFESLLKAETGSDQGPLTPATSRIGVKIDERLSRNEVNFRAIQVESVHLKIIVQVELAESLEGMGEMCLESYQLSQDFLRQLVPMVGANEQEKIKRHEEQLQLAAMKLNLAVSSLKALMRNELYKV